MGTDVSEYIRKCNACAKRKTGHRVTTPLGEALVAHEFLGVVSLDTVQLLPITEKGNKYLLTFVYHFTRFCEAIRIARHDTETIARNLKRKICKSVHHHTVQLNQPTRCNNFSSLLLDVYVQLNMFRASSRPSSGAQQLQ
jgi:hypothetical protein